MSRSSPSRPTALASSTPPTASCTSGRWATSKRSRFPAPTSTPASPFFSPDGQWVGFFSYGDSLLRKIAIGGGSPVTLCKVDAPWGATWDGDTIFVASGTHGIMRVSANGGEPEVVVKLDPGEAAYGPQVLDGGRLLYALATGSGADRWDRAQIVVQSMTSGERHVVVRGGSAARYLPTGPDSARARDGGHLVYAVGNSLLAAPFDVTRLELRGSPVPIVEPVTRSANSALQSGVAQYAVSATGMLAYLPGPVERRLPAEGPRLRRSRRQDPDARPAAATVHSPAPVARRQAARGRAPTMAKTPMCGSTTSSLVARCAGSRSAVAISIRSGRATAASSPSNRIAMATTPSSDNRPTAAVPPNA